MRKRAIIFHPAIAPYRIDFFNSLNKEFEAIFYFEFRDALEQSFIQDKLKAKLLFTPRYLASGLWGIKNLRLQVISILWKEKPDVVFCSEFNILGFLVLFYKFLFNRQLHVFTICDDSRNIACTYSKVKKVIRAILLKAYTGIILTNQDVLDWYQRHFQPSDKFLFFPIIQHDEIFREALHRSLPKSIKVTKLLELTGKRIVFFVGRLINIKNLPFLMKGFATLVPKFPDAVLVLVGEGEQEDQLRELTKELVIEKKVLFVGKKQGDDLLAYYNMGQIFVLPSFYERFGAVVNEALLAGCYTLCSNVAGASCLVKFPNGDIFNPMEQMDFVKKLDDALSMNAPLGQVAVKPNRMWKSYDQYISDFFDMFHRSLGNNYD